MSSWTALTDNSWQSSCQTIGQLEHSCHGCRHTLALSLLTSDSVRLLTAWREREKDGRNEEDKIRDTEWWKEETNLRIATEQDLRPALKTRRAAGDWACATQFKDVQRHLLLFRRHVYVFIYCAHSSKITLFSDSNYLLKESFLVLSTSRRWNIRKNQRSSLPSLICAILASGDISVGSS